jgi:hypothetical protein
VQLATDEAKALAHLLTRIDLEFVFKVADSNEQALLMLSGVKKLGKSLLESSNNEG